MAQSSEIDRAVQKLDAHGWNKEGRVTLESRIRVILMTSRTREKVLELSLSHENDGLQERVEYVFSLPDTCLEKMFRSE